MSGRVARGKGAVLEQRSGELPDKAWREITVAQGSHVPDHGELGYVQATIRRCLSAGRQRPRQNRRDRWVVPADLHRQLACSRTGGKKMPRITRPQVLRTGSTSGRAAPTRDAAPPAVKEGRSHHLKRVVVVLEVWPESHWAGFVLREAEVFKTYMAWWCM